MKLHSLKPAIGSIKKAKRIGRGQGSQKGGTSTRGHKGAQSRSGYKRNYNKEGGQLPLHMRLPKFGFKSLNRIDFKPINLDSIQKLSEKLSSDKIIFEDLTNNGLVSKKDKVKILGRGKLNSKINISAHAFSKSALEAIKKLGGKSEILKIN